MLVAVALTYGLHSPVESFYHELVKKTFRGENLSVNITGRKKMCFLNAVIN